MDTPIHQSLHQAVLKLLRPLVRVLLRHGVSHDALAELGRRAFVEEGFAHMQRSGKRPTVSGVSALTGLSRKEVKRLSEADFDTLGAAANRRNRAIQVISGWTNDPDFRSGAEPAVLRLDGDGASFAELVRRYSGDVTPVAMLGVLRESGNLALDDDRVELKQKAYIPLDTPLDLLNILGTDAGELIETIGHNMLAPPGERRFQRKVSSARVREEHLAAFREFSNRRSQQLLEEYDAWLAEHEVNGQQDDAAYVAVGIYYVEHPHLEATP